MQYRTDLAYESCSPFENNLPDGVRVEKTNMFGFMSTIVEIDEKADTSLIGKPAGVYVTIDAEDYIKRKGNGFSRGIKAISEIMRKMLDIEKDDTVLVAGLGNTAITPDALGPMTVDNIMVTRHLKDSLSSCFESFRPVCAIAPGVLASTGLESADIIKACVENTGAKAVIAADALAANSLSRLCRTVQIANTGIVPGSGVNNARNALNKETLGVPVIAIGVPTVVEAGVIAKESKNTEISEFSSGMIVTPREIDKQVSDMAKLIGYGINLALHSFLTESDITMFLE